MLPYKSKKHISKDNIEFKIFSLETKNGIHEIIKTKMSHYSDSNYTNSVTTTRIEYFNNCMEPHNPNGPAVIISSSDIQSKICFYYLNGKMVDSIKTCEYDDWLKNKQEFKNAIALFQLSKVEI